MTKDLWLVADSAGDTFGNQWVTILETIDGDSTTLVGKRPCKFSGVHALVKLGSDYILMDEDDGTFFTLVFLSLQEVQELRQVLQDTLSLWKDSPKSLTLGKPHTKYSVGIHEREGINPLLHLQLKAKSTSFDLSFLPDLIEVLDI